jgi:hypothetical protein
MEELQERSRRPLNIKKKSKNKLQIRPWVREIAEGEAKRR